MVEKIKWLLAKKINKITMTDVAKISRTMNMSSKYKWAISNTHIDVARDLRLTDNKITENALAKFKPK